MAAPAVMLPPIEDEKLWDLMAKAEELGLRLEMTDTGLVWEAMPGLRHQELAVGIYGAVRTSGGEGACECYRALDVYIRFPSGIVKRPDLSIFCRRPSDDEGFVHAVPEAVVEITSPESEDKDLIAAPPLYLANGVKDVIVVHRSRGEVHHWTVAGSRKLLSPAKIVLTCGCEVTA
jgi:Uma2 family endonuclease